MNENFVDAEEIVKSIVQAHLNDPDHNVSSMEIIPKESGYKIITTLLSHTAGYIVVDIVTQYDNGKIITTRKRFG